MEQNIITMTVKHYASSPSHLTTIEIAKIGIAVPIVNIISVPYTLKNSISIHTHRRDTGIHYVNILLFAMRTIFMGNIS